MNKQFLKKIPLVKRLYPSLSKKLLNFFKLDQINYKFYNVIFSLNINEPMEKEILLFDYYENAQIEFLIQNFKDENFEFFLDVGANSGLYSLIIGKLFNKTKIKAFEPIFLSRKKLERNIFQNNDIKNIDIFEFGLSDKNTKLLMKAYKKNDYIQTAGFGVSHKNEDLSNLHTETAHFKKADELFEFKKSKIAIKIDTEGHEFQILEGMEKIISNNKIFFQIEIFEWNYEKINNFLINKNFRKIHSIKSENKIDYYYKNYN